MASGAVVKRAAQEKTVTETVVSAVAEFTGSKPTSLDPLYGTLDPEALDALFDDGAANGRAPDRVSFTYSGCTVVVTADGTVQVSRGGAASREHDHAVADNVRS